MAAVAELHIALAWIAAGTAFVALVVAAARGWADRGSRLLVDRAILAVMGTVLVASLAGIVLPVSGRTLSDPLHALYGAVAFGALPVGRYVARAGDTRRIARYATVGCLLVLAAMLRLFMTGR